jgi:arylsulfatase A-like enzyme/tetratricopeptide (TPR) repeat protein
VVALALLFLLVCKRAEAPKYNVLLITLDTLRADHVGAYGSTLGTTPAIDALAARGVRFDAASSAVPLTLPSHATILSGLLPLHHGVRNNGVGSFPENRETLATVFSAGGYRTAAFTAAFVLDHRFGLNRGFSTYDDEIPRDPNAGDHLEAERRGDVVADRVIAWLKQEDARPFFAWVHLYDAHAPYAAPEPFASRLASSPYDGEIAFVDQQVQRILAALDARGQRERTIVVIAGDHGEALGEHGELTHGLLLYEPTLHVPLIIAAPQVSKAGVVKAPVSLADVAPTVAALAGVALPPEVDGRSLADAIAGKETLPVANIYAETEYPTIFGWSALSSLRRGESKFISSPHPELYDLSRDAHEARNLYTTERRTMRTLADGLTALRATAVASTAAKAPDAETLAKLASLGYVGALPSRALENAPDPKTMVPLFRKFEQATWAMTAKKYGEAAVFLEELLRQDAQNPVFRSTLAKVERQRGNATRAIELYRESVAFAPDDAQAWYSLAAAFQEAGDLRHAGEAVREALRRDAKNPDAHNVLGIIFSGENKPEQALAEFQQAVAMDPRNARIYNNIGNAFRALGQMAGAEAAFRRSIELAPAYADPLNGLAALSIDQNRFPEAIAALDRALEIAPDHLEARLNRAVAQQLNGNNAAAVADYRIFVEKSAHDAAFARQREVAKTMLQKLGS